MVITSMTVLFVHSMEVKDSITHLYNMIINRHESHYWNISGRSLPIFIELT